jgi:circadian clock protein KaiC
MEPNSRAATGIGGLDFILNGGFLRNRIYLIRGPSGTGKTTIGLRFLLEGAKRGEKNLYISFLQNSEDLRRLAQGYGWSIEDIQVEDMLECCKTKSDQTIFHSAYMEHEDMLGIVRRLVVQEEPQRLVFDAISELRIFADGSGRYKRQILDLKRFLSQHQCTVLLLSLEERKEVEIQGLVDGVLDLEMRLPVYGSVRRQLAVMKMRGASYESGYHDFDIEDDGAVVHPRLKPPDFPRKEGDPRVAKTGVNDLDSIVGGGLSYGSSCLIIGASGTGKSSLATIYAHSAARMGEKVAIYLFQETEETYILRSEGIGIDIKPFVERGLIQLHYVDVGKVSPGAFTQILREAVDKNGVRTVVIDSLTGYYTATPEENLLTTHLHDLFIYLNRSGVLTLLTVAQHGFLVDITTEPGIISLLADTVIHLRFFEAMGRVRTAVSVLKKRLGPHDKSIRELRITSGGIEVGAPIKNFRGILTGVPLFHGEQRELMEPAEE